MMNKSSVFVVLLLVLLGAATLTVATPAWDLQHVSTHYDANRGETHFTYSLNSADADVLHLYVADASCSEHALSAGAGWTQYQSNHIVSMHGYKYVYGQEKANTQTYVLALKGKVGTGLVTTKVHGSGHTVAFSLNGPSCQASVSYPSLSATDFPDTNQECTGPNPPTDSKMTRCHDAYELSTLHSKSANGLTTQYTQVEHGDDTTAPEFVGDIWLHKTIECTVKKDGKPTELPPMDTLTASDNCDPTPNVDSCVEEHTDGKCEGNFFKTRTWTVTDRCGNAKCLTQTITVQDTVAPTLSNAPQDVTYDCDPAREAEFLQFTGPTADDDCCIKDTPQFSELHIDGKCRNTFTKERTWTVEDCCGNKAEARQTLVIKDDTAPTLSFEAPEDPDVVTVECNQVPEPQEACATDECTTASVKFQQIRHSGSCPFKYTLERIWTAVDECGNEHSVTKTVNVIDTSKPTFNENPPDVTVECGNVPPVPVVTANDVCGSASISYREDITETSCDNTYTLVRTWTATDACGNSEDLTQTIKVQDTTDPIFDPEAIPDDQTGQCAEDVVTHPTTLPVFSPPTKSCDVSNAIIDSDYSGNCKRASYTGVNNGFHFPGWIDHPIFAVDSNAPATLHITHENAHHDEHVTFKARIFSRANTNVAFDVVIKLSGRNPTVAAYVKSFPDSCYNVNREADFRQWAFYNTVDEITLTGVGSLTQGAVIQADLRTINPVAVIGGGANGVTPSEGMAIEAYWHVAQPGSGVTIPVLQGDAPLSIAVNLDCTVYITGESRGCESEVTPQAASIDNEYTNCVNDFKDIVTWTITDCAGNTASVQRTATIKDTTPPQLHGVPSDDSVSCDNIPPLATPTATDNCNTFDGQVSVNVSTTPGNCVGNYVEVRTWTTTDACGNTHSESQTLTVTDTVAPQWSNPPQGSEHECDNLPSRPSISATDNCGSVSITDLPDGRIDGSCKHQYTLTQNWKVVDDCGNERLHTASYPIVDNKAPSLEGVLPAVSYYCNAVQPPAEVCAKDTCDDVRVEFTQTKSALNPALCAGGYTLTRTWTAIDACGNSASDSQLVTVYDDKAPVPRSNPPSSYTVECDKVPASFAPPEADDDCSDFSITPDHSKVGGDCTDDYVLKKKWVIADVCGNSVVWNYDVTVEDTTAPTIQGVPADTTVYCTQIPPVASPTAQDNCDPDPVLTYKQVKTDGDCTGEYTLTRTWTAKDRCGNTYSESQVITVVDGVAPTWNQAMPGDIAYECSIPAATPKSATDACGGVARVALVETDDKNSCPKTLTRVWTATDDCGNFRNHTQVITLHDTIDPSLSGVPSSDDVAECTHPGWATVTGSDICDGTTTVAFSDGKNVVKEHCNVAYTRTWTTTDTCGNSVSDSQTITVKDTIAPRFLGSEPTDVLRECSNPKAYDVWSGEDDCDPNPLITDHHIKVPDATCPGEAYVETRKWVLTDRCGHTATRQYKYTVVDTTAPRAVGWDFAHSDVVVNSDACQMPPVPVPEVEDNCDAHASDRTTYSSPKTTDCLYRHVTVRRWDYVDACGNRAHDTQRVEMVHTTPPTLVGVPADDVATCVHPPKPTVSAHDVCGKPLDAKLSETVPERKCAHDYTLRRTWKTTDACGEEATQSQDIVVSDVSKPVLSSYPVDRDGRNMDADLAGGNEVCNPDPQTTLSATDNCAGAVTVTPSESTDPTCLNEFVKTYTWSTVDSCDNRETHVQKVFYKNTFRPVLTNTSLPGDASVTCESVPVQSLSDAQDACQRHLEAVEKRTLSPGSCTDEYSYLEEWDAVDACGLTVHHQRTLNVYDRTPPTLSTGPASVTVECGFVPDAPTLTATDNCDTDVVVEMKETKTEGSNCCDYSLKRVWTATDNCGNTDTHTQIITVVDTIPPVLVGVPQDVTVPCEAVPSVPVVTSNEAPIAEAFCTYSSAAEDISCFPSVTSAERATALSLNGVTYAWDAASTSILVWQANGNTFIWGTVVDTTVPTNKLQLNLTLVADSSLTAQSNAICDATLVDATTFKTYGQVSGSLIGPGVNIEIAASSQGLGAQVGVGASNLNAAYGASVFVKDVATDATGIIRMSLFNQEQGCDVSTFHDMPNLECGQDLAVSFNEERTNGSCADVYTLERTWSADDNTGNTVTSSQTISVYDNEAPDWDSAPSGYTVECGPEPVQEDLTATDKCDPAVVYDKGETKDSSPAGVASCPQNYNLNRWWTATDRCGNDVRHEQQIRFRDTADPSLVGVPGDITEECSAVSAPADVSATDACDSTVSPTYSMISTPGRCADEHTELRKWSVTDACGHTVTDSHVVSVVDTSKPVIGAIPPSVTLECKAPLPEPLVPYTDNCAPNGNVGPTKTSTVNSCQLPTYVQTWSVSDNCGNSDSKSRTVTYRDTGAPRLSTKPSDVTVACDKVPDVPTVTGSDDCDGALTPVFNERRIDGSCVNEYVLKRTWTVTDCSGNSDTHTQTITVEDNSIPELSDKPADSTVHCKSVPAPPEICASDNCGGLTETFEQKRNNGICSSRYTLDRIWTATDACGNTDTHTQTLTVHDDSKPVFNNLPGDVTEECSARTTPIAPGATDDCDASPQVVLFEDRKDPGDCTGRYTHSYVYKTTDECGNWDTHTTVYTITDNTAPSITTPPNQNVKCHELKVFGVAEAEDNCDAASNVTLTFVDSTEPGSCSDTYTMRRTWTAVDTCGNRHVASSVINVVDDSAPQWESTPSDRTNECSLIQLADPVAEDNCDSTISYTGPTKSVLYDNCPYNQGESWTWTATDNCGNSISHTAKTESFDNEDPELHNVPIDETVACDKVPAVPTDVYGTDNCDPSPHVEFLGETRENGTCVDSYKLTRSWKVTDACGRWSSKSYTLTVVDNQAPTYPSSYSDSTHECSSLPAPPTELVPSDNCDSDITTQDLSGRIDGSCPYQYDLKYHWTAEDNCGNTNERIHTVHIVDTSNPEFGSDAPNPATYECDNVADAVWPSISDNCGNNEFSTRTAGHGTYEYQTDEDDYKPDSNVCQSYSFTRTWTITDACGNQAVHTQPITVKDTTAPTFNTPLPVDITYECHQTIDLPVVTASDNCGSATVTMKETKTQTPGKCEHFYTLLRVYTATDLCGRTSTYSYTVTVEDTTNPTLDTVPGDITYECDAVQVPAEVCASDLCDDAEIRFSQSRTEGTCTGEYSLTRTWTADDLCGNTVSESQIVSVVDTTSPTFDEQPGDYTTECTHPPTPVPPSGSDNCGTGTVTMVPSRTDGGCAANYTQHYEFKVTDECGNFDTYTQNVTVEDTVPPRVTPSQQCFTPQGFDPTFDIKDVTDPAGTFFHAEDDCSTVEIFITGCSSDQDAALGQSVDANGYIPDCMYHSGTDTLTVRARYDWQQEHGRTFTVTGYARDACGHITEMESKVWIPRDAESVSPDGIDPTGCVYTPCDMDCPCEYNQMGCEENDSLGWSLEFHSVTPIASEDNDDFGPATKFTYKLVVEPGKERPKKLFLGVDLTQVQIVSVSPDRSTSTGFAADGQTYLSGITWSSLSDTDNEFSFTVSGSLTQGPSAVSYQLADNVVPRELIAIDAQYSQCTPTAVIAGPHYDDIPIGNVRGKVVMSGSHFGVDNTGTMPISGVVVALATAGGQFVAETTTAEDGSFSFRTPSTGEFTVRVTRIPPQADGYLTHETAEENFPLGVAQSIDITPGNSNVIKMWLNSFSSTQPSYERTGLEKNFKGLSRSIDYWIWQVGTTLSGYGESDFTPPKTLALFSRAASIINCGSANDLIMKLTVHGTPLQKEVITAALNKVSGLGFFEKYRWLEGQFLNYAQHVACEVASPHAYDLQDANAVVTLLKTH